VKGIKRRSSKSGKVVYIHNSGAAVIAQKEDSAGVPRFSDLDAERIDKDTPDTAYHRDVDLHIRKELANEESEQEHNARVAILMPPIIYGVGTGPFNKASITVPALCRATVTQGTGISVGNGENTIDAVHVQDLVDAYLVILAEMEKTEPGHAGGPYWFAETEHYQAISLTQRISTVFQRHGKSDGKVTMAAPTDHNLIINAFSGLFPPGLADADQETKARAANFLYVAFASTAQSSADRLRKLGWGPRPGRLSILESVENVEIPEFLKD